MVSADAEPTARSRPDDDDDDGDGRSLAASGDGVAAVHERASWSASTDSERENGIIELGGGGSSNLSRVEYSLLRRCRLAARVIGLPSVLLISASSLALLCACSSNWLALSRIAAAIPSMACG